MGTYLITLDPMLIQNKIRITRVRNHIALTSLHNRGMTATHLRSLMQLKCHEPSLLAMVEMLPCLQRTVISAKKCTKINTSPISNLSRMPPQVTRQSNQGMDSGCHRPQARRLVQVMVKANADQRQARSYKHIQLLITLDRTRRTMSGVLLAQLN